MQDPVCGMTVDPHKAAGTEVYNGVTYAFCSPHCLEKFRADPAQYVAASHQTHGSAPVAGTVYTCPMHPEVRQDRPGTCPICGMALEPVMVAVPGTRTTYVCPMHPEIVRSEPGTCPICGMALEPRTVSLEEEANPELVDMTRRFWICVILTMPSCCSPCRTCCRGNRYSTPSARLLTWVQLLFATPVVLWGLAVFRAGGGVYRQPQLEYVYPHRHRDGNGVWLQRAGDAATGHLPGLLPHSYGSRGRLLRGGGRYHDPRAPGPGPRTPCPQPDQQDSRALGLAPKTARRLQDEGTEEDVSLDQVQPGDRLRVRPGENPGGWEPARRAQCGGRIHGDRRAAPVEKVPGSHVTGGTVNGTGSLLCAPSAWALTLLAQIVRMVSEAQRSRAPIQRLADVVSGYFVPAFSWSPC